jgi:hypothetical protein
MMKYRIVFLFVAFATLSPGQSSQPHSSSATAGSGSLKAATKPLTPKSAMPSHRKTATVAPKASGTTSTTAQLNHLERQNNRANSPKSPGAAPGKDATLKSGSAPAGKNSGIDFKYQKPAGAQKGTTRSKGP